MLTHHTYFNLDAYKNPTNQKIWDHTLYLPYSKRFLEADQGALPTGKVGTAAPGSINDFASKPGLALGHARTDPKFAGNCGANGACEGYNGYFLIEDAPKGASSAPWRVPSRGLRRSCGRTSPAWSSTRAIGWTALPASRARKV